MDYSDFSLGINSFHITQIIMHRLARIPAGWPNLCNPRNPWFEALWVPLFCVGADRCVCPRNKQIFSAVSIGYTLALKQVDPRVVKGKPITRNG